MANAYMQLDTKLHTTMINWLLVTILLSCLLATKISHGQELAATSSSNGLTLTVHYQNHYPSSESVEIRHTIINGSKSEIRMIFANTIYDLNIKLFSPRGDQVSPFPYDNDTFSRFLAKTIFPGEQCNGDSINLEHYFPIRDVGEYRCQFTRRVYEVIPGQVATSPYDAQGKPVDLVVSEIKFRIESLGEQKPRAPNDGPMARRGDELNGIKAIPSRQSKPLEKTSQNATQLRQDNPATDQQPTPSFKAEAKSGRPTPLSWWMVALFILLAALLLRFLRKIL